MTVPHWLHSAGPSVHWSPLLLSFSRRKTRDKLFKWITIKKTSPSPSVRRCCLQHKQTQQDTIVLIYQTNTIESSILMLSGRRGPCDDEREHRQIFTYCTVLRHFSRALLYTQIDTWTVDHTMLHGMTVKFKTPRLSYNTSPFKTFILRTSVAIKKPYTYDSALQILMHTFTILLFGDVTSVGISEDFRPPKQQRCGDLKFQRRYISNLTRLDERGEAAFIFE
jgi:hypothetical protein